MTKEERKAYYRDLKVSAAEQERAQSRRAWDKRNYRTISCRVPVETAQRFRKLCFRYGKTPYRALKDAVEDALRCGGVE